MTKYLKNINKLYSLIFIWGGVVLSLGLFSSCEATDEFKVILDGIPQISYGDRYRYKYTYTVGDTLTISGILYPEKGLKISVGEVEDAPIVKTSIVFFAGATGGRETLDQVSVIITEEMGIGTYRPVSVTLGANKVDGTPIDIYGPYGEGSLDRPLKLVTYTSTPFRPNTFLHCTNGKGDVYYIRNSDRNLWHIDKEGNATVILTQADLQAGNDFRFNSTTPILAGGVNPQGTKAWISVQTTSPTTYRLLEADLQTKEVKILNISTALGQPYQGNVTEVNTIVSGIYPNSAGRVYLLIGLSNSIQAVGVYDTNTETLSHIYRPYSAPSSIPGTFLGIRNQANFFFFYPEDDTMMARHQYSISGLYEVQYVEGYKAYNLLSRFEYGSYTTDGGSNYIGAFRETPLNMGSELWGLLPLSGQRLLGLYGLNHNEVDLPRMLVMSFNEKRFFGYAPSIVQIGNYPLNTTEDRILNYDEDGHLYMTANRRGLLLKTAFQD